MRSTITSRGQTVIPAEIRKHFHLSTADRLEWILEKDGIRIVPVKENPIASFRGKGKGGAVHRLMVERNEDRKKE